VRSAGTNRSPQDSAYHRDTFTYVAFLALFAFGILNSALGAALPYLRAIEHLSYLPVAGHQVAFALGGGLAGLLSARWAPGRGRTWVIRLGLAGMALGGFGLSYGNRIPLTVLSAFLMSLAGTTALISLWSALAETHGSRRAVAMTEGEVSVSLGAIAAPLLLSVLANTALGWRGAFVVAAATVVVVVLVSVPVAVPPAGNRSGGVSTPVRWLAPTLMVAFTVVAVEWSVSFWLASYLNDDVGLRRGRAVAMVGVFFAAMLIGRLGVSQLARWISAELLLAGSLVCTLAGLLVLLPAHNTATAVIGVSIVGVGLGPTFPLTSAVHVAVKPASATTAMSDVLAIASAGQILGPLLVGAIAAVSNLRAGLLITPAVVLAALAALHRQHGQARRAGA
jgi:MFS family permease